MTPLQNNLEHVIRAAGEIALTYFNNLKNIKMTRKSPRDLVTEADLAVEIFLKKALFELYPAYGFWGEESGQTNNQTSRWVVDPIDGTHSFLRGQYFWSISIALEINQEIVAGAVYAPALDDLYCAEKNQGAWKNGSCIAVSNETNLADTMVATGFACLRAYEENNNLQRFSKIAQQTLGQRRFGSAALDLCLVADGQVDAFWEQKLNLYDIAAGTIIVTEAGGTITDFKGRAGVFPEHILATNGKILPQILTFM